MDKYDLHKTHFSIEQTKIPLKGPEYKYLAKCLSYPSFDPFREGRCVNWGNRSSCPEVFCKKVFLETSQNSQGNTCARVSSCNFIKKRDSDTGVFL